MPLLDTSYKHWQGTHLGLWRRRLVIASNGLTACVQTKGMKQLIGVSWMAALTMAAVLFMVGQLLVADSVVVRWAGNLNPDLQGFVRTLTTWLEQHPQISVRTTQNLLFNYFCIALTPISIFGLGIALPLLITRDLASNAIIIYSSKAVSRGDYLLGKFSTAFGLLALTWLGPVCAAWFVGNLLAPDWRFFWHSRAALAHALLYGLIFCTTLSVLALGVSAVSQKEKSTPALWFCWWLVGGVVGPIAAHTQPWLRHVSFNYNLNQIATAIFRPSADIQTARDNIPVFGMMLNNIRSDTLSELGSPSVWGSCAALLLMAVLCALIIRKRVKPE